MSTDETTGPAHLTPEELDAEAATGLPAKEVMSLLDLNANLDLALDVASPIDLAIGANANIAAPIDAAVGANVLSTGASAGAEALQGAEIHQGITGDASATAAQQSAMDQTGSDAGSGTSTVTPGDTTSPASVLDGNLLNVNVNLNGDLKLAAPIDGAVAANANAAAPIDAAVSANIASDGSDATAIAHQDAIIDQSIQGDATANGQQTSDINQ